MARIATITSAQILEAARAVFLEQGLSATTVDVANRAGISSASIFKHFPTKEALFFAAMARSPRAGFWTPELEQAIGHGNPRADLLLVTHKIADYVRDLLPGMMMTWAVRQRSAEAEKFPHPVEPPQPPDILNDFAALVSYLGREMALGRIQRGDPIIPAMTLLHTATGLAMTQKLQSTSSLINAQSFLEDFVALLWRGLEPAEGGI